MHRYIQRIVHTGLITLGLVSLSMISMAADDSIGEQAEQSITVTFAASSVEPWGIKGTGEDQGLLVDVIKALSRETGIHTSVELQPYPRVAHSLLSGRVDFAFLFDSPSTQDATIRIGHLVESRMIVVGRAGSAELTSLADLEGKTVGIIRGSKYGPDFDNATHFRLEPVSSMEQGLAMLMRGRTDVMVGTDQSVFWAMREMNVGAKRLSKLFVMGGTSGSLYMSNTSPHQALIPVFEQALEELHRNGTMKRVFDSSYIWAEPSKGIQTPVKTPPSFRSPF
ncbi:MAG: substrate-binding periplasmic protein [Cellvibrionaceae bacterium]